MTNGGFARFDDGEYQSHCWACGHAFHATRSTIVTRCRCCYEADNSDLRAIPDGTVCPLDSEATGEDE